MNYKLLNCLLASCILSYCSNTAQASDCIKRSGSAGTLVGNKSINDNIMKVSASPQYSSNSTKNSIDSSSNDNDDEGDIEEDQVLYDYSGLIDTMRQQMNSGLKVKYSPFTMWFDYQSLFEKTRNTVLEIKDDIKVEHTEFSENDVAREALFGNSDYENTLNKILCGDIETQQQVMSNLFSAYCRNKNKFSGSFMLNNYYYLLGVIAALSKNEFVRNKYIEHAISIPNDFYECNILKINYYNIMSGLS
ncbi:MAG: hypothetical protein IJ848_02315 [Alphaproteobacteria bacterium]|nr:hypothetical protein [Alphaproteobacteria bacterium]